MFLYLGLNFRSEGMGDKVLLMGIFSKKTSVLTLIVLENYPLLWYNGFKFIKSIKRGFGYMMVRGDTTRLLPEGVGAAFKELRVLGFLRAAGIKKSMGLSSSYLFTLIFSLIFEHKNWFRLLQSTKSLELPSKDAVYRFMNCPRFAWRRFLSMLSTHVIAKVSSLTSSSRIKV